MKKLIITFLTFQITIVALSQSLNSIDLRGKWFEVVGANCQDSINMIEFFPDSTFFQIWWQTSGPFDLVAKKGDFKIIEYEGDLFLRMENEQQKFGSGDEFSSRVNGNSTNPPESMYLLLPESSGFCLVDLKIIRTGLEYEWRKPAFYVNNFSFLFDETQSESIGVFHIPSGYTGRIMVALNQENGQDATFDKRNRRVLSIPESGLLKTQVKPMPVAFAKKQFEYYYQTNEGVVQELKQISHGCLYSLARLSDEEIKSLGYDSDEVYVYPARYNVGRNLINEQFGEEITGQVKYVIVDSLRNLIPKFD